MQPPTQPGQPQRDLEPLDPTPLPAATGSSEPAPATARRPGVADGLASVLPGDDDEAAAAVNVVVRRPPSQATRSRADRDESTRRPRSDDAPNEHRASGSRRVVALLGAVAVLGAAGYLGYSQLAGTDAAVSSPSSRPKPAATPKFALPNSLANLTQITPAQAKALTTSYTALAAKNMPTLPRPTTVSAYHPQKDARATVNVVVYKAGSPGTYEALRRCAEPSEPGKRDDRRRTGDPRCSGRPDALRVPARATNTAWCAWSSTRASASYRQAAPPNPTFAAIYTRELRAFAER